MIEIHQYKVGELYHPDRKSWQEGAQFSIRGGQPELLLFFNRPNFHEILAVKKGECEFGVLAISDVIFFLYRFSSEIPWSDCPFSIHLVAENERALPDLPTKETRLTLQIILIEANTGKIQALRTVSLSPEFSAELLKLTVEQAGKPFNAGEYDRQLVRIYREFPHTTDLRKECFVFTTGGV